MGLAPMTALRFTLFQQMPFVGMFYGSVNYLHREVILLFLEKRHKVNILRPGVLQHTRAGARHVGTD